MIKTKVADVTSKVVSGGEGCIGWMTNIVVTGSERYKSESTSGGVRVNLAQRNAETTFLFGFTMAQKAKSHRGL